MKMLYIEKELNRNSSSIAIAAELGVRKQGGELWHRRGDSWRDEGIEESRLGKGD